jgi:aminoglycoside/choline kinase family phosphotransferase
MDCALSTIVITLQRGANRLEIVENYFNYFTEIEEKFRKCRAEAVLLSPLDWALVESWKEQGFPLEAVLAGIERSFEKFKAGKRSYRKVNSLAYCSQEVFRAVEESRAVAAQGGSARSMKEEAPAPFSAEEISRFLARCAGAVESAGRQAHEEGKHVLADELAEAVTVLNSLGASAQATGDLEETERNLTALEERLNASLLRGTVVETLAQLHAEVDRGLIPYRRKMAPAEVDLLERRFLKNRLFEHYKIPRLSLFYL